MVICGYICCAHTIVSQLSLFMDWQSSALVFDIFMCIFMVYATHVWDGCVYFLLVDHSFTLVNEPLGGDLVDLLQLCGIYLYGMELSFCNVLIYELLFYMIQIKSPMWCEEKFLCEIRFIYPCEGFHLCELGTFTCSSVSSTWCFHINLFM